jgi:large subunit ribosomal protein L24
MSKFHVKTGSEVKVLVGKDRGKTGKVVQVFPKLNRVVVEGVNVLKRHLRTRRQGEPGRVIEFPMPIHASNVALLALEAAAVEVKPQRRRAKTTSSSL